MASSIGRRRCCARTISHKRDVMVGCAAREFGGDVTWPEPRGGFFLWATLPPPVDADAMIPRAIEHGVIYVAGEAFFVNGSGGAVHRLSFSAPPPERIEEGSGARGSRPGERQPIGIASAPAAR